MVWAGLASCGALDGHRQTNRLRSWHPPMPTRMASHGSLVLGALQIPTIAKECARLEVPDMDSAEMAVTMQ